MSFHIKKCYTCDNCRKEIMESEQIHWINIKVEGICQLGLWEKDGVRNITVITNSDFCSQECFVKYFTSKFGGKK